MKRPFHLGRLFGVPVGLSPSWFIAFGLVTALLALRVYPLALPFQEPRLYWAMAALSGLLFFASVLLHELAHSVVAKAFGIPVHGITLFLLGGVSHLSKEAPKARQEFLMAFAGPVMSFALAGLALGAWMMFGPVSRPIAIILEWLWLMNFGLGLFNMMPGFPLDGGRLLRATIWALSGSYFAATRWSSYAGRGIAWLLIGYGVFALVMPGRLFVAVNAMEAIWLIAIGGVLEAAARTTWQQARNLMRLRRLRIRDTLEPEWPRVAPWARLRDIEEEGMLADPDDHLLVIDDGVVVGIVPGELALRTMQERAGAQVREVMLQSRAWSPILDEGSAMEAWERMEATDEDLLPVVSRDARFLGLIRRRALVSLLEQRS